MLRLHLSECPLIGETQIQKVRVIGGFTTYTLYTAHAHNLGCIPGDWGQEGTEVLLRIFVATNYLIHLILELLIIKDKGVHLMIWIPGSLSFAKMIDRLSHTVSPPIRISTAFFLCQMQQVLPLFLKGKTHTCTHNLAQVSFVSPDLPIAYKL